MFQSRREEAGIGNTGSLAPGRIYLPVLSIQHIGRLCVCLQSDLPIYHGHSSHRLAANVGQSVHLQFRCLCPLPGQLPGSGTALDVVVVQAIVSPRQQVGAVLVNGFAVVGDLPVGRNRLSVDLLHRRGCHRAIFKSDLAVFPGADSRALQELGGQVAFPHVGDKRVVIDVPGPSFELDHVGVTQNWVGVKGVAPGVFDETEHLRFDALIILPTVVLVIRPVRPQRYFGQGVRPFGAYFPALLLQFGAQPVGFPSEVAIDVDVQPIQIFRRFLSQLRKTIQYLRGAQILRRVDRISLVHPPPGCLWWPIQ